MSAESSEPSSHHDLNQKRRHSPEIEETSMQVTTTGARKKYNVISEDVRKSIITRLTENKGNIKEVANQHGLKLSTCKAILQVYQREGRIGKKTTRDRKQKIVSTILIALIDPMNPSSSTLTPYVTITEAKTASKKDEGEEERGEGGIINDLIKEAFKNAQEHLKTVIDANAQAIYLGGGSSTNGTTPFAISPSSPQQLIPASTRRDLDAVFLEAQRDAIKSLLKNSPSSFPPELRRRLQPTELQKLQKLEYDPIIEYATNTTVTPIQQLSSLSLASSQIQKQNKATATAIADAAAKPLPKGRTMKAPPISRKVMNEKQQTKTPPPPPHPVYQQPTPNAAVVVPDELFNTFPSVEHVQQQEHHQQQLISQQQHSQHYSSWMDAHLTVTAAAAAAVHHQNSHLIAQSGFCPGGTTHPSLLPPPPQYHHQMHNSHSFGQGYLHKNSDCGGGGGSSSNSACGEAAVAAVAAASVICGGGGGGGGNGCQQLSFQYSESPSQSTMNASPAITPFLNAFTLNSPSFSTVGGGGSQYGGSHGVSAASSFLSPLNLSMNSSHAPMKPTNFSLNHVNVARNAHSQQQQQQQHYIFDESRNSQRTVAPAAATATSSYSLSQGRGGGDATEHLSSSNSRSND